MIVRSIVMLLTLGATVVAGLASRSQQARAWVPFLAEYAGDTLWASAAYYAITAIFPRLGRRIVAIAAILISFCVELSQLYHAPWIDSIRSTRLGALLLGHGFVWTDLICYALGVLLALSIDALLTRATRSALIAPR